MSFALLVRNPASPSRNAFILQETCFTGQSFELADACNTQSCAIHSSLMLYAWVSHNRFKNALSNDFTIDKRLLIANYLTICFSKDQQLFIDVCA